MSKIDRALVPANTPEQETLDREVTLIVEIVDAIQIDSPEMYSLAGEELTNVKDKIKALNDQRLTITRPMDAAKKAVMALFKAPLDKLEKSEAALKRGMLAYAAEQQRIADEERRKAEEAAEAERQRLQAQAAEAEQEGDVATAMTIAATAEMVTAAPAPVAEAPKAAGIATTTRWSAEVTDKLAYIKHVLESRPDLIDSIQIDMKMLNQQAISLKDKLNLPGIKAVATTGLSVRG